MVQQRSVVPDLAMQLSTICREFHCCAWNIDEQAYINKISIKAITERDEYRQTE